jgi:hypothetical protein
MRKTLVMIAALWLLAACQPLAQPTSIPPTQAGAEVIQWLRSPQTIVFRADITGGYRADDSRALNEIPRCTIYGDNRVVWVNELGPFTIEVLHDIVSDDAIRAFIDYLTVEERIYTYGAGAAATGEGESLPVVEQVLLAVNAVEHRADGFSGWDADWFARVTRACQTISQAPVLFAPEGAWIIARETSFDLQAPIVQWVSATSTTLSLSALAESAEPRWLADANLPLLWNYLHTLPPNLLFAEGERYFELALQVPGVTRDAPPPP